MRTLIRHSVVLAALAIVAACGGEEKPAQEPSAMTPPPPPPAPPPPPPAPAPPPETTPMEGTMGGGTQMPAKPAEKPLSDPEIVAVTSTANTGEIEMGQLATKTATNPDVKNYAAMMVTQHRDMENKAKALEAKAKIAPAESEQSTALKSDVQLTLSTLKTQKGKDFDRAYMDAQVKAHRDVLNVIDNKLLPNAQNTDLKSLLSESRTHVASHLAKAEQIQQKLESGAPTKPTTKPPTTKPAPKNY